MAVVTDVKQEDEMELDDESEHLLYPKIELKVKKEKKQCICYVCGKSFGNKGDLSKHISRIHEAVQGSKVCDQCAKTFKNNGDLYHHKAQVHTHEILKCAMCSVDCKNRNALRKHEKKCGKKDVPLPLLPCTFCDLTFSIHRSLYKHLKQQHNHVESESECDICGKMFERASILIRHKKKYHDIEECNGRFVTNNKLNSPLDYENVREPPVSEEKTLFCVQSEEEAHIDEE
eukprot:GFUD01005248.1.p1 GENE.GFUD01005248.1~~GFUD01005248.1.p1  ORF type:complete len:231 (+),score=39.80 GFUD01005248.1:44-736(+)